MSSPVPDQSTHSTIAQQNLSTSNASNTSHSITTKISQVALNTQKEKELNIKSFSSPQLSGQLSPNNHNLFKNQNETRSHSIKRELSQNQSTNPTLESIAVHRKRTLNADTINTNLPQNIPLPLNAQMEFYSEETEETSSELSPGRKSSVSLTDLSPRSENEISTSSSSEQEVFAGSNHKKTRKLTKKFSTKNMLSKKIKNFNLPNSSRESKEELAPPPPKFNLDICKRERDLLTSIINSLGIAGNNQINANVVNDLASQLKKMNFDMLLNKERELYNVKDYFTNSKKISDVYKELLDKIQVFYRCMESFFKLLEPAETVIIEENEISDTKKTSLIKAVEHYLSNEKENRDRIKGLVAQHSDFLKNSQFLFFDEEQISNLGIVLYTNFINQTVLSTDYLNHFGKSKFKILKNNIIAISKSGKASSYYCLIISRQLTQYKEILKQFEKKMLIQLEWKEKNACPHPYEDKFLAEITSLINFLTDKEIKTNDLLAENES